MMSSNGAWIAIVTGMSGSGKTTAIQALEDLGFYCIDNLPPQLAASAVQACLQAKETHHKIALVLDVRTGSQLEDVPTALQRLEASGHIVDVLFLDATDEVLLRRFSETRRRHPLAAASVAQSIEEERRALAPLRNIATRVIDTSNLNRHELRAQVSGGMAARAEASTMSVSLVSFGFKYGLPTEADLVFDVRHLRNPFFSPELRDLTGEDSRVRDYVKQDPEFLGTKLRFFDLLRYVLPLYQREGKRYLTVAVGCTGGKHRSVTMAIELLTDLDQWKKQQAREPSEPLLPTELPPIDLHMRHRDTQRT